MFKTVAFLCFGALLASCGYKQAQIRDREEIKMLVQENSPEVMSCYQEALQSKPGLASGEMMIRADQHIDGSLHSFRMVRGFAGSNEIYDCVVEKISQWKASPPKTWGPVELSFDFRNTKPLAAQSRKDLGSMMQSNETEFKDCYGKAVQKNPDLSEGSLLFKFRRTREGWLKNLELIQGFKGSETVFQCMRNIMNDWRLAETSDDTDMTWTYKFNQVN